MLTIWVEEHPAGHGYQIADSADRFASPDEQLLPKTASRDVWDFADSASWWLFRSLMLSRSDTSSTPARSVFRHSDNFTVDHIQRPLLHPISWYWPSDDLALDRSTPQWACSCLPVFGWWQLLEPPPLVSQNEIAPRKIAPSEKHVRSPAEFVAIKSARGRTCFSPTPEKFRRGAKILKCAVKQTEWSTRYLWLVMGLMAPIADLCVILNVFSWLRFLRYCCFFQ